MAFAYYSHIMLLDDSCAPAILHIAFRKYLVAALSRFPAAACDGSVGVVCIDSWMSANGRGVLVPAPSGVYREVDDIDLVESIRGSSFDRVTSLFSHGSYFEVIGPDSIQPNAGN